MTVTIREALPADAGTIVRLIRELAAYENLVDLVRNTEADVLRDGFGEQRCFECLLAEADGEAVGFAIHRPSYSTFDGRRGLYVEDLFVAERARGLGVGRMLMARLATIARERGCSRMSLAVLHWNPARDFYRRLGFVQVEDWLSYRCPGMRCCASPIGIPRHRTEGASPGSACAANPRRRVGYSCA